MKILSWNTEKGPVTKRAAIEEIITRAAPDVAFLYEASNSFDEYPYPDWLADTFCKNYSINESPCRSKGSTGPTGLVVLIAKRASTVGVKAIEKRYAVIDRGSGSIAVGLHIPSASQGCAPVAPAFFAKLGVASSVFVTGDFNQIQTDPAVTFLTSVGFIVANPSPRVATSTKGRPIDHTLAKPDQARWIGYENTGFAASDHLAQIFEWV